MWVEIEPDGKTGMITASIPQLGNVMAPLSARTRPMAEVLRPLAELHALTTGRKVHLAHMREVEG